MKKFAKNIRKIYRAIDVSPFAYGKLKIIIFVIWGLNALVFLGRDMISDTGISPEQLNIVSREFFDYNILPENISPIKVNIIPYLAGVIVEKGLITRAPELNLSNSNRAPPEI